MNTAILIHGMPGKEEYYSKEADSPSNAHWFPWLQRELIQADYCTQAPEMPLAYMPNYEAWKKTFEQFDIDENTILVGHSCGGGFLVRYLSENSITVKRTVLVAPWLDPHKSKDPALFDFKINSDLIKRTDLHMLYSDNDEDSIDLSVEIIKSALPDIISYEFKNYGHFCKSDLKTEEFPELLNICLKGEQ